MAVPLLTPRDVGLGLLFDLAPEALLVIEQDAGQIALCNPAAERLLGRPAQELIGLPLESLVPTSLHARARAALAAAEQPGASHTVELAVLARDRQQGWVEATLTALPSVEGRGRYTLLMAREVTGRSLPESFPRFRQEFATILDGVADGVIVLDAGRQLTYCNAAAARLLGFSSPAEALATPLAETLTRFEVLDEQGQPLPREQFPGVRALGGEETPERMIRWRIRATSEERWSIVKARPIRDAMGRVLAAISMFADVTLQQRAVRSQRLVAEASRTFAEAGLDVEAALQALARAVAEGPGDGCSILLLSEDGAWLRPVAVVHPNPAITDSVRAAMAAAPQRADEGLSGRVLRSGEPLWIPVTTPDELVRLVKPEYRAHVARYAAASLVVVPLRAHGRTLGTLVATRDQPGRPYDREDLALLQELADRAALAVDNARLYRAEQRARTEEALARTVAERAAERIARLQAVTASLSQALTTDQVAAVVIEQGVAALGAYAGAVFLVDAEGQFLELAWIAGYEASRLGPWSRFPLAADVPLAEAVRSGEAIWLEDASEYALRYPQLASTHEPRTRALACIPLSTGGRALGGLVLSFDERRPFPPEDRALILAVAGQCAQALGRARAFEAERQAREVAEAAQRRLRFLAEASRVLGSALEYETTLQTVARLALPDLADWCVVDLEQPDGTLRRVAVAHSGGAAGLEALGRAARQPIHREAPHPHAQALRTGRSMLVPAVSESLLRVMARDEEHLALLQQLALVSGIVVPLAARGRTFGVLSLARAAPHAPYTEEDLALAEELARRAAVAIDNATLYTQAERSVQEAQALYRAALAIGGELELEARLERVLDATLELLEVSHAHLGLVDPERREVVIVAERGLSSAAVGGRIPLGAGLAGRVVADNRPLRSDDLWEDPRNWNADLVHQEGVRAWLGVPLADATGAFGMLAALSTEQGVFTDAHERRLLSIAALASAAVREARLRQQLEQALQARDEFLSVAAHELKTPVTGIKGYAQLLLRAHGREGEDPGRFGRLLQALNEAADRLAGLTQDLLEISRLHRGQLVLRKAPLDLGALVERVTRRHADLLGQPEQLLVDLGDGPHPVEGDADRLEQVLTNLLENASKYSPRGAAVHVALRSHEAGVLLSVRDEGIGLPTGSEQAIFEPFGRAANAIQKNIAGIGLGLHICRSIIERHSGRIWAESPGEGRGTTLFVWLPRASAPSG